MIEKTKLPQAAFVAENATVRGRVTAGPEVENFPGYRPGMPHRPRGHSPRLHHRR